MIYKIIYLVLCLIWAIWSVRRQKQRWSGNSNLRIISVFIINFIGLPICLIISIYNKNMFHNGSDPIPIKDYIKK